MTCTLEQIRKYNMDAGFLALSKRKKARKLREAAKLLEKGWTKNTYESYEGQYCAIGALGVAVAGFPTAISYSCHKSFKSLADFNDSEETTQKDVVKRLRSIAQKLEHGGEFNV